VHDLRRVGDDLGAGGGRAEGEGAAGAADVPGVPGNGDEVSELGWAGFAVADLALAGGAFWWWRALCRAWRDTVENWTDEND
jgi:hypothetical protein